MSTTPQRHVPNPPAIGDMKFNEVRAVAKKMGINCHKKSKAELVAEVEAAQEGISPAEIAAAEEELSRSPRETVPPLEDEVARDDMGEPTGPAPTKRVPLGARQPRLQADQRPGYHRRWINDKDDRVRRAAAGGYTHVQDRSGEPVCRPVGTQEAGGVMMGYLMEIPQNLRDEDFEASQNVVDKIDETIFRGTVDLQPGDARYVPEGGIKIDRGNVS